METEVPHHKQRRKGIITLRPLNKEDEKLVFMIIEQPSQQEVEIKRKPRKEYRTKKKLRLAAEREEERLRKTIKQEHADDPEIELTTNQDKSPEAVSKSLDLNRPQPQQSPTSHNQQPQPERRTRMSNACRVATGKSYKCKDCDFSTDRINNIIIHLQKVHPDLKKA